MAPKMDRSNARGANTRGQTSPQADGAEPSPKQPTEEQVNQIAEEAERQARPENSPV